MLYLEQTKKALNNFQITGHPYLLNLAKNTAIVKIACTKANYQAKLLSKQKAEVIIQAAKEIIIGKHDKEFAVDAIQGGAGTSINMNVNEVIAARASKISKKTIHPIDQVNLSQSTNDVVPTAFKLTLLQLIDQLIIEYQEYFKSTETKAKNFKDIIKVGRTHLQDAVPISLGQEFQAHAAAIAEDTNRLQEIKNKLYAVNLGGTALGTGTNAPLSYRKNVIANLKQLSGYPLKQANNLVYSTQYLDSYLELAGILNVLAANIIKFSNDLRLLSSGPCVGLHEISFSELQNGSSIMPGKVNPVMAEMWCQIAFQVIGNGQTVMLAVQAGQLELNVMLPIIARNLFDSLIILTNGSRQFTSLGINKITANKLQCQKYLENSLALATYLSPKIGYDQTSKFVKEAIQKNKSLKQILIENKIMSEKEYNNFTKSIIK